mgnify:CR=1 FL=1
MNKKWLKIFTPVAIIVGALIMYQIMLASKQPAEQKPLDNKPPLVEIRTLNKEDWQFKIRSQGVISPLYQTQLTTQVAAKVVKLSSVFIEGGFFSRGDVLVQLEDEDFKTQLKSAQANLAKAKAALKEEKARGAVAEQEWRQMAEQATPLALRIPQLETETANVESAQAQVEQAKRNLERTKIRAPYDGIVVKRSAQLGQYLAAGSSVGLIYSTDIAEIRLPLSLEDSKYLNLRQKSVQTAPAQVTLISQVGGRQQNWQAELVRNEAVINEQTRMIYVVARLKDPYNLTQQHQAPVHFGQFVEADIDGKSVSDIVRVERSLLTVEQQLILLNDDSSISLITPQIVRSEAQFVYIAQGIREGDKLIISSLSNPVDGMKVRVNNPTQAKVEESK